MPKNYALFTSGARFGLAVLRELRRLQSPPRWLVIPEYPPAPAAAVELDAKLRARPGRQWMSDFADDALLYAPRGQQKLCAARLRELDCDFLLVACWPCRIEAELISAVSAAALNLHPSLLPRYRGPSPLAEQWATDDRRFGVTLHLLAPRLDAGDIVAQRSLGDSAGAVAVEEIELQCARLGARLFVRAMAQFPHWNPRPQQAQEMKP